MTLLLLRKKTLHITYYSCTLSKQLSDRAAVRHHIHYLPPLSPQPPPSPLSTFSLSLLSLQTPLYLAGYRSSPNPCLLSLLTYKNFGRRIRPLYGSVPLVCMHIYTHTHAYCVSTYNADDDDDDIKKYFDNKKLPVLLLFDKNDKRAF